MGPENRGPAVSRSFSANFVGCRTSLKGYIRNANAPKKAINGRMQV